MKSGLRLNIGCGYARLEGWLNLDASPASAADRLMQAHDLALDDGCAAEVRALQLVEHLGFFKAKYFLSECWRVLAPGGSLLLETPDPDGSFRAFLAGDHAAREAALGWIFGPETPGMGHAYLFPRELLLELLAEAGFPGAAVAEFEYQPHRPALRFLAAKAGGEGPALNAALRRRLLDRGVPRFSGEEESAGLELAVRRLVAGGAAGALEQALVCAPAALEYYALAGENEERPSRAAAACARLADWDLQGRLAARYAEGRAGGLSLESSYAGALALGRELTAAALEGREPAGPAPAAGAPAAFTLRGAEAWDFRRKFPPPAA